MQIILKNIRQRFLCSTLYWATNSEYHLHFYWIGTSTHITTYWKGTSTHITTYWIGTSTQTSTELEHLHKLLLNWNICTNFYWIGTSTQFSTELEHLHKLLLNWNIYKIFYWIGISNWNIDEFYWNPTYISGFEFVM